MAINDVPSNCARFRINHRFIGIYNRCLLCNVPHWQTAFAAMVLWGTRTDVTGLRTRLDDCRCRYWFAVVLTQSRPWSRATSGVCLINHTASDVVNNDLFCLSALFTKSCRPPVEFPHPSNSGNRSRGWSCHAVEGHIIYVFFHKLVLLFYFS